MGPARAGRQSAAAPGLAKRQEPARALAPAEIAYQAPRRKNKKNKGRGGPVAPTPVEVGATAAREREAAAREEAVAAAREEAAAAAREREAASAAREREAAAWHLAMTTKKIEEARSEAYTRFEYCSDELINSYPDHGGEPLAPEVIERIAGAMEAYRTLSGEYPYNFWLVACAPLFELYLRAEGIKPEILEDVRRHVTAAIKDGDAFPWETFRDALVRSGRDWRGWHDRELYVCSVAPGAGVRALREAAQLGFVDHRLDHAVTTMQRLVRYRQATPLAEGQTEAAWLADFGRLHHRPEPAWREHGIHLESFADSGGFSLKHFAGHGIHFSYEDPQDEASFVFWNRQCIPEYIRELSRGGAGAGSDFEFAEGIALVVGEEDWEAILAAIRDKREALYEQNCDYLLDDDALAKTGILIRLHAEGRLRKERDPRRDVLKFIRLTLNEPPPPPAAGAPAPRTLGAPAPRAPGGPGGGAVPIARCYIERLDALPLPTLGEVFRALPACLAARGCDLLHRFSKVDVGALDGEGVRSWFLNLVVDEVDDLCGGSGVDPRDLRAFLGGRAASPRALELARGRLRAALAAVRAGEPLYSYTLWAEPVKVAPVLLLTDREAALGEGGK